MIYGHAEHSRVVDEYVDLDPTLSNGLDEGSDALGRPEIEGEAFHLFAFVNRLPEGLGVGLSAGGVDRVVRVFVDEYFD